MCGVCMDRLEEYWDEDLEEWRYKDAIRIKNKVRPISLHSEFDQLWKNHGETDICVLLVDKGRFLLLDSNLGSNVIVFCFSRSDLPRCMPRLRSCKWNSYFSLPNPSFSFTVCLFVTLVYNEIYLFNIQFYCLSISSLTFS